MKKAKLIACGRRIGRLIYYGYAIYGDRWGRLSGFWDAGYRFLPRRDKTGLTPYLYGLKTGLEKIREKTDDQYEIICYCSNDRLYKLLLSWGEGYRDKMIIDLVNEVRRLGNSIGYLKIVSMKKKRRMGWLIKVAEKRLANEVEEALRKCRSWITSEDGYLVCLLDESTRHIPLEYFSKTIIRRENNIKGVILVRSSGSTTRLLLHSLNGSKEILDGLKKRDYGYICGWRGTYRCLYVTRSSLEDVEELLLEVSPQCSIS